MASTAVVHKHDAAKLTEEFFIATVVIEATAPSIQLRETGGDLVRLNMSAASTAALQTNIASGGWTTHISVDATGVVDLFGDIELIGTVLIDHTALVSDDHALELDVDCAGFGDVEAIDVVYTTGAIASAQDEAVVLINIDETAATGGDISGFEMVATEGSADKMNGLFVGVGIGPIEQLSGLFGDADLVDDNGVDQTTALSTGGAGNITLFSADNEYLIVGNAAKFQEIEAILDTGASGSGITPTFEYSTGVGTWAAFTPIDGTGGFRNTGVLVWLNGDIPSWATGASSQYLIRITRTKNTLTTAPIADLVKIAATTTEYFWDKDGRIAFQDATLDTLSADPAAPAAGSVTLWASDGTGSGSAGDVLSIDSSSTVVNLSTGGGGGGDFSGPASSTDNAVVRFNGTGGKTGQDSVVIIGDLGEVTGVLTLEVGSAPSSLDTVNVDGAILLTHTSVSADDHALEIDVDAAGYGDVEAIDVAYTTGAIASGSEEAIILINVDESAATGGDIFGLEMIATEGGADEMDGLFVGAGVGAIEQLSGSFADADLVDDNGTDETTALSTGGAGNVAIFTNDNEYVIVGDAAMFEEIEFILDTGASGSGITPTFEFSTGVGTWSSFSPIDGTNQMRNTGVVVWLDSDIPTWAVGAGSQYLIRITRTKNSITTTPIADLVKIAATNEYKWDKDGNVTAKSVSAGGSDTMTVNGSAITSQFAAHADGGASIYESHTHSATAGDGGVFYMARSRGSEGSETIVSSGDMLGTVAAVGYDGTDYALAARIDFVVDGTPGSNDMPAKIDFKVSADGTQAPAVAMTIRADKSIEVASTVDGRDLATDGTKLDGIESGADVTDTANVTAAGALMDSEVDADLKTLVLPASTTISSWGATLIDDATAAAARVTLGLEIGVDVQNHSVVLDLTTASYTTALNSKLSGIETGADVTDTANVTAAGALMDSEVDADLKTLALPANTTISTFGASLIDDAAASNARTTLGLVIGADVQAHSAVLDATTASFLTADETKLDGIETGADVTDATNVNAAGAVMNTDTSTASMSFVIDEDAMGSDSATKVPTQQSVKAYVDLEITEQGSEADARALINAVAHASGGGDGDRQNRKAHLRGQSTTSTFVSLTADGGSDSATDSFQIPEDSAAFVVFGVLGVKSGGSEVACYIVELLVKRFSSTTTLVWSNVTVNYEDDSAWDVQAATYSLGVKIEAKGNTSETVNWSAYLRSVELVE